MPLLICTVNKNLTDVSKVESGYFHRFCYLAFSSWPEGLGLRSCSTWLYLLTKVCQSKTGTEGPAAEYAQALKVQGQQEKRSRESSDVRMRKSHLSASWALEVPVPSLLGVGLMPRK